MPDFDWNDLRVVLEVSRAGSLAQGAERLGLDQSTVGRRLTKIEAELGATLFLRSRKGLVPTDAGQLAIRRATDIERRIDVLSECVSESGKGLSGDVELYGNPWLLDRVTAVVAPRILAEHSGITLRINGTGKPHLDSSGAAIGFFLEAKPQAPRFELRLGTIPYRVYRAKDRTVSDRVAWVAFHEPGMSRARYLPFLNRLRRPDEPIALTASETGILMSAVASGIGQGLLPECLAGDDSRLEQVGDTQLDMEATFHLHPDSIQLLRVQTVIRKIREAFIPAFLGDVDGRKPAPLTTKPLGDRPQALTE
ncbi:MAG: LysR family transcriptional regulator [Pseudomonadota bacterium]